MSHAKIGIKHRQDMTILTWNGISKSVWMTGYECIFNVSSANSMGTWNKIYITLLLQGWKKNLLIFVFIFFCQKNLLLSLVLLDLFWVD